jgi:hypothetical protein
VKREKANNVRRAIEFYKKGTDFVSQQELGKAVEVFTVAISLRPGYARVAWLRTVFVFFFEDVCWINWVEGWPFFCCCFPGFCGVLWTRKPGACRYVMMVMMRAEMLVEIVGVRGVGGG